MRVTPVDGNTQRLDGGAMFGNAPRALWSRWIAPDEDTRVPVANLDELDVTRRAR